MKDEQISLNWSTDTEHIRENAACKSEGIVKCAYNRKNVVLLHPLPNCLILNFIINDKITRLVITFFLFPYIHVVFN
jgi:hypothetical protein